MILDSDAVGKSVIFGTKNKHKRNKWANATESAIGKRIGFVFNNEVITDPTVNSRIESGCFAISNPHSYDLKGMFNQMKQEKIDSIVKIFKGWNRDSIYDVIERSQVDSAIMTIDYWDAYIWKDSVNHPNKDDLFMVRE